MVRTIVSITLLGLAGAVANTTGFMVAENGITLDENTVVTLGIGVPVAIGLAVTAFKLGDKYRSKECTLKDLSGSVEKILRRLDALEKKTEGK